MRTELDAVWELVAAPSAQTGLNLLLERFGRQVEAEGAALLLRDPGVQDGPPRIQHRWRLYDGADAAALEASTVRLAGLDRRLILREHAAGGRVVVAAPVHAGTVFRGALCAVFADDPRVPDGLLAHSGAIYAALVALCLGADEELAALRTRVGRDPLTGCLDRRAICDVLEEEVGRSERHGRRLACCMLDLDGFKGVNDGSGHLAGDRILHAVAQAARNGLRAYDRVGRYGGDEFLIVMPETPLDLACDAIARVTAEIASAGAAAGHRISAGAGVVGWQPGQDAQQLVASADHALLEAKAIGPGTVVRAGAR